MEHLKKIKIGKLREYFISPLLEKIRT